MNDIRHSTRDPRMDAITALLEAKPDIVVPNEFAARVMARLPEQRKQRVLMPAGVTFSSHFGTVAANLALVVLLPAMVLLAPRTQSSPVWLGLQGLLFLQFCALLLWVGLSRRRLL